MARKSKRTGKCRWYAGRVRAKTKTEHRMESMGTGIYEAVCLRYTPTERKRPRGWRYAIGPYSTHSGLVRAVKIPGASAVFRGEGRGI